MRIFLQEVRRLLRPAPLLAALILLLLFGQTTFSYTLRSLPEQADGYILDLYESWRGEYGLTLEPEELPGMEQQLEALLDEAEETIAHWDESVWAEWGSFSELGITSYAEYETLLAKTNRNETENRVASLLLDSRSGFLQDRIRLVRRILEEYDFEMQAAAEKEAFSGFSEKQRRRCEEIAADPEMRHSILYSVSIRAAHDFAMQLAVMVLAAAAMIVTPYPVRSCLCGITQLQWPARVGRKLAKYQLRAVLAVSACLSAVLVAVYGTWFCISWRAAVFWDCTAYAMGGSVIPWFRFTYGQYLLLLGAVVICFGVACGAGMFFLSQFSKNYISALLKAIPLFLALAFLSRKTLSDCLYFGNALSELSGLPGTELLLTALLLLLSLFLAFSEVRRIQKCELP